MAWGEVRSSGCSVPGVRVARRTSIGHYALDAGHVDWQLNADCGQWQKFGTRTAECGSSISEGRKENRRCSGFRQGEEASLVEQPIEAFSVQQPTDDCCIAQRMQVTQMTQPSPNIFDHPSRLGSQGINLTSLATEHVFASTSSVETEEPTDDCCIGKPVRVTQLMKPCPNIFQYPSSSPSHGEFSFAASGTGHEVKDVLAKCSIHSPRVAYTSLLPGDGFSYVAARKSRRDARSNACYSHSKLVTNKAAKYGKHLSNHEEVSQDEVWYGTACNCALLYWWALARALLTETRRIFHVWRSWAASRHEQQAREASFIAARWSWRMRALFLFWHTAAKRRVSLRPHDWQAVSSWAWGRWAYWHLPNLERDIVFAMSDRFVAAMRSAFQGWCSVHRGSRNRCEYHWTTTSRRIVASLEARRQQIVASACRRCLCLWKGFAAGARRARATARQKLVQSSSRSQEVQQSQSSQAKQSCRHSSVDLASGVQEEPNVANEGKKAPLKFAIGAEEVDVTSIATEGKQQNVRQRVSPALARKEQLPEKQSAGHLSWLVFAARLSTRYRKGVLATAVAQSDSRCKRWAILAARTLRCHQKLKAPATAGRLSGCRSAAADSPSDCRWQAAVLAISESRRRQALRRWHTSTNCAAKNGASCRKMQMWRGRAPSKQACLWTWLADVAEARRPAEK